MKSTQIALTINVCLVIVMQGVARAQSQTSHDPDGGGPSYSTGTVEEEQHWKIVTGLVEHGDTLSYRRKWDDALVLYRQAAKVDPDYHASYEGIGDVLLAQGNVAEAIANYKIAVRCYNSETNHFRMAIALGRQHNYDEAISEYQTGLSFFHGYPEEFADLFRRNIAPNESGMRLIEATTLTYRADKLNGVDKGRQAIPLLQQALELEPHLGEVHLILGNALRGTAKRQEARA